MKTADTIVRHATPADEDALVRLLVDQLVEHHLPATDASVRAGLRLAFAPDTPARVLLAERDGAPVGVLLANRIVSVEKAGHAYWIEELYVAPAARRTGVARALVERLVAEGRAEGVRALDLEVVPTQAAAFALYRTLGFTSVDRARLTLDLACPEPGA